MMNLNEINLNENEHSLKLLNNYLKEVITNSSKCQTCIFKRQSHNDKDKSFCFFGFNCIQDDFSCYNNGI